MPIYKCISLLAEVIYIKSVHQRVITKYYKRPLSNYSSSGANGEVRIKVVLTRSTRVRIILPNFFSYLFKTDVSLEKHVFSIIMKEII